LRKSETLAEKVEATVTCIVISWQLSVSIVDVLQELSLVLAVERQLLEKRLKEGDSERPDVHFFTVIFFVKNLRRHRDRRPAIFLNRLIVSNLSRKTEISKLKEDLVSRVFFG
jgi:hypothetical protein